LSRAEAPSEPVGSVGSGRRGGGFGVRGVGVREPAFDGGFDLLGLVQTSDQRGQPQVDLVDLGVERAVSLRRGAWSVSCSLLGVRAATGLSGGWRLV